MDKKRENIYFPLSFSNISVATIAYNSMNIKNDIQSELEKKCNSLHKDLREQLRNELREQLRNELREQLRNELREDLREDLREQLREDLREQLREQLREDLRNELREDLREDIDEIFKNLKIHYEDEWNVVLN